MMSHDPKCDAFCPSFGEAAPSAAMAAPPRTGPTAFAWAARLALTHEQNNAIHHLQQLQALADDDDDDDELSHRPRTSLPVSADRGTPASSSSSRLPAPAPSLATAARPAPGASYTVPAPLAEVSPGVLADGSRTTAYPAVQRVLREPALGRKHPLLADRVVEALVILAVMRQPHHPLHLLYWDGFQREKTDAAERYNKTLRIWDGLGSSLCFLAL
jgi:hypothetical protein